MFATVAVLFIFAADLALGGHIRALVRSGGSSVWNVGSQFATSLSGSGFLSSSRALREENESLKQKIAELEFRLSGVDILEKENDELRAFARLAEGLPGFTVPIVSSLRASPYGTFVLGAGEGEGVLVGDLVVAVHGEKRFAIGRVNEVSEHRSLVVQIFAPDVLTEATLKGASLTVEGRGGGNARAEVPRALSVAEGDIVTSPGLGGLPIGVVGNVSDDPAGTHKVVYIGLPVNIAALRFVYVISLSS